jgi:ATP-dependent DNA ligase
MLRLHPAQSRVELLSTQHPATYVAFDVLAIGDEDVRRSPFGERRKHLQQLIPAEGRVVLTRATTDSATAQGWLEHFHGGGIDGVMAKPCDGRYEAGKRAMLKVKAIRTADCVVAGIRTVVGEDAVASVLLGLWDGDQLRHVGVCSTFAREQRAELLRTLAPLERALAGHPWELGFGIGHSPIGRLKGSAGRWVPEMSLDWMPLEPRLVAEVAYDTLDAGRFRHPARFLRWRPDRDPASCTFDQLSLMPPRPAEVLDR